MAERREGPRERRGYKTSSRAKRMLAFDHNNNEEQLRSTQLSLRLEE